MAEWFYTQGGQQWGPVGADIILGMIRSGNLGMNELAWRDGLVAWTPIFEVPELAAAPAGSAAPGAVGVVSYYTAPSLAAKVIPYIRPDDGPFMKLGNGRVDGWIGPTCVSPVGFYIMKASRDQQQRGFLAAGVVGALVAAAVQGKDRDIRTCTIGELPETVRNVLDRKGKKAARDAIIVTRDTVRLVKVGWINNHLTIHVGTDKFGVTLPIFRNGKVRRFLRENGWLVNQEMQPTGVPIYGQGMGRTPDGPPPKAQSTLQRVLLIIAAIAIFCAVVWLRIMTGR